MTTYEKLRSIINASNPERLRLGFGVEVMNKAAGEQNPLKYGRFIRKAGKDVYYYSSDDTHGGVHITPMDNIEILGAPLTLADVLMAIPLPRPKITLGLGDAKKFLILETERVWANDKTVRIALDMLKPVSQWPEETLESIIKLIE